MKGERLDNQIKIPKKIKVGAHDYLVVFDRRLIGKAGVVDHATQIIFVNPAFTKSMWVTVLLHEYVHAIDFVYTITDGCTMVESSVDRIAESMNILLTQLGVSFDWSDIPNAEELGLTSANADE